jgi:hypothetical protein
VDALAKSLVIRLRRRCYQAAAIDWAISWPASHPAVRSGQLAKIEATSYHLAAALQRFAHLDTGEYAPARSVTVSIGWPAGLPGFAPPMAIAALQEPRGRVYRRPCPTPGSASQ